MPKSAVQAAFEKHVVVLPLDIIVPQKVVTKGQREGDFYRQIAASLKHVGLIEPLIVYSQRSLARILRWFEQPTLKRA